MKWFTYILLCNDNSYYVGHTQDIQQRVQTHNDGQEADYTAKRKPVKLVYKEELQSKPDAIAREVQIKKWSKAKKQSLIKGDVEQLKILSKCRNF